MTTPITRAAIRPGFDDRPSRRRIGLILLATDHTSEQDFARMVAGPDLAVHATRIAYANPVTPATLRAAAPHLAEAAALILPDEPLDAIVFSCTSACVVIGDAAVSQAILQGKPGTQVITPPDAALSGLAALGARRVSVLTPYTVETSEPMARYFTARGLELTRFTCLGLEDDRVMARLSRRTIVEAAIAATAPQSDALFISCTALRSAAAVDEIEAAIGRPVVTSNQATAWAALSLCGAPIDARGVGALMRLGRGLAA